MLARVARCFNRRPAGCFEPRPTNGWTMDAAPRRLREPMKILITGGKGMLGRTLLRHLTDHELVPVDIEDFDLRDAAATRAAISTVRPDVIIHGAAMTAVDKCETEQDLAFSVNAIGSAHVAIAAHDVGARLLAISTDYVFAGDAASPYHEWDAPDPRTIYGASKLAGENAVRTHCPNHLVLRVAWLYGGGGPSFVHTMLRLGAQGGDPLRVVNDQHGNPTSTDAVAGHIKHLLTVPTVGTLHLTCEDETTWYDFTQAIFRHQGFDRGVEPCSTSEYPRPAPRPANSRLEKRGLRLLGLPPMPTWQETLSRFLTEHPQG